MDKSDELVMRFRVQIMQRPMAVLGRASNFKMLLCYARKPCSVASIVGDPSATPNSKNNIGSVGFRQTGNKAGVKRMKPGKNDLYCSPA